MAALMTSSQDSTGYGLQLQARRLVAFMTPTLSRLNLIGVRYRPAGFVCHVPMVRDAVGCFGNSLPIPPAGKERA